MAALGLKGSDFVDVREFSATEQNHVFCAKELDVTTHAAEHGETTRRSRSKETA